MTSKSNDELVAFAANLLTKNLLRQDLERAYDATTPNTYKSLDNALEAAAASPDTNDYDMLILLTASELRSGNRLPDYLATFAADVLDGTRARPTRRGIDPYHNWMRDYNLWASAKELSLKFHLQLYTNNELATKVTAAEIISRASGLGLDLVKKAIRKFK